MARIQARLDKAAIGKMFLLTIGYIDDLPLDGIL
jgi:hypothetical protein